MAKNNEHKKIFRMDEFGRKFYCQHARLNLLRSEKKQAKKKARQARKRLPFCIAKKRAPAAPHAGGCSWRAHSRRKKFPRPPLTK